MGSGQIGTGGGKRDPLRKGRYGEIDLQYIVHMEPDFLSQKRLYVSYRHHT